MTLEIEDGTQGHHEATSRDIAVVSDALKVVVFADAYGIGGVSKNVEALQRRIEQLGTEGQAVGCRTVTIEIRTVLNSTGETLYLISQLGHDTDALGQHELITELERKCRALIADSTQVCVVAVGRVPGTSSDLPRPKV